MVLSLISTCYILMFLVIAGKRLVYPFELEWIEGAMIDQILWILQGRALYAPPDIHFIPFAYTPIYFYLSAGLMKWVGAGFIAPRLVSILSASGCFVVIFLIVRRATGRSIPAILAVGIFAASFQLTGVWMDLAKVDSLFLLLILLGFFFSQPTHRKTGLLVAGVLFTLAFYTKQLALPVILIFAPVSLWVYRGRTWPIWVTSILLGVGALLIADRLSSGWFSFYTLKTVFTHPRVSGWLPFWQALLPRMWPAVLLSAFFTLKWLREGSLLRRDGTNQDTWNLLGFCAALILTSWSIYFKIWTYRNDLIPAVAGLAILCGLCAGELFPNQGKTAILPYRNLIIPVLLVIQLALLVYHPLQLIPSGKNVKKSERILERIQSLPGEVLNFNHGYWNFLAGKTTYLHTTPLGDVLVAQFPPGSDAERRKEQTERVFQDALSNQVFDWIVVDKNPEGWLPNYLEAGNFLRESEVYFPGRDQTMIPKYLLTRNPTPGGETLPQDEPLP